MLLLLLLLLLLCSIVHLLFPFPLPLLRFIWICVSAVFFVVSHLCLNCLSSASAWASTLHAFKVSSIQFAQGVR